MIVCVLAWLKCRLYHQLCKSYELVLFSSDPNFRFFSEPTSFTLAPPICEPFDCAVLSWMIWSDRDWVASLSEWRRLQLSATLLRPGEHFWNNASFNGVSVQSLTWVKRASTSLSILVRRLSSSSFLGVLFLTGTLLSVVVLFLQPQQIRDNTEILGGLPVVVVSFETSVKLRRLAVFERKKN